MCSRKFLLYATILFCITACKKDDVEFPPEPSITFAGITPANAEQFTDSITITINYEDGDGDLGENSSTAKNCFVTDNRIGITYQLRIQQLAPNGASIPIKGNLNIKLGGQAITDSTSQQSVNYTVYVKDRAGHSSNSVQTSNITLHQ